MTDVNNYIVARRKSDNKLLFFKAWGLTHLIVLTGQALTKGKAFLIIAGIDGLVNFSKFLEESTSKYNDGRSQTYCNCKKQTTAFNINAQRKVNYVFKRIRNTHTNRVKHCKCYKTSNS